MDRLESQYWLEEREDAWRLGFSGVFVDSVEGDWIALEISKIGEIVRRRDAFGFLTTDRATHDLRAPRPFRIVRINAQCLENPELARLSPMGDGWLLEVELLKDQRSS